MFKENNQNLKDEYTAYRNKILTRIQKELNQKKISQKEIGNLCGLSQPTISKLLKGDSPLTLEFLFKLCKILDIQIETLVSTTDTLTDKLSNIQDNLQNQIYDNFHNDNEAIVSVRHFFRDLKCYKTKRHHSDALLFATSFNVIKLPPLITIINGTMCYLFVVSTTLLL